LRDKGKVTRGWLGVAIQPVTADLAQSFGLADEKGALVSEVVSGSPADKAGLKAGDIILEFDGRQIHEMNELPRIVAATLVGRKVPVRIMRDGKQSLVTVEVDRLKDGEGGEQGVVPDSLGLTVRELNKELAARLKVKELQGVVVTELKADGLAQEAGIAQGDIIREIDGRKITTLAEYEAAISAHKKGTVIRFLLRRGESSLYIAFKVE
jgi:serine protease Do